MSERIRPQVSIMPAPRVNRVLRKPVHHFHLRTRPWQIQPSFIAPVLPGETMKNLLLQVRAVTDPIKNPLIGWWYEHYIFYVKHRDLASRDLLEDMMLDPNFSMTTAGLTSAADTDYYHYAGHVNWAKLCLQRVTEEYFRNEDETWNGFLVGTMPAASVNDQSWLDSVRNDADYEAVDPVVADGADTGTALNASEVQQALRMYNLQRMNNFTDMSYEEFLSTYGVHVALPEQHRPELVRYVRDWTYPTSHVEPTTGAPTSACSWKIAERADKDRFFKEPGFLFGCCVVRPKVYRSKQIGSVVDLMENAFAWLPALLGDDYTASYQRVATGVNGPLSTNVDEYWIDVKDLLLYGDQFLNFSLAATDAGLVALPTTALQKRYAAAADADALFVSAAPANQIRQDGICSMQILGRQRDTSPRA
jgi:hypothetical protein